MIEDRLRDLWDQLRGRRPHMPYFLEAVRLQGIRGISDLRVEFTYPVSVIAGENASGKSTVLFAAACAYEVPGAGAREFVPSTLFPSFRPKAGHRADPAGPVVIEYDHKTPEGRLPMLWRYGKGWNRSFRGRAGAKQPRRPVYLRTLANLSNPSEVRGILSASRRAATAAERPLTPSQIEFAQQVLPFRYSEVIDLAFGANSRSLLFAEQRGGAAYSELHMAAGERSIFRLAQEVAQAQGALILIDEIEAGLHPWIQQLLMLQLQQVAIRNDLQIVVTTHSPVILDSVPRDARIFLTRDLDGAVRVQPPYRDVVQDALYGRSNDTLNVLCEDEVAEAILLGVSGGISQELRLQGKSLRVGRDTGADEFHTHARAFKKFGQLDSFVFVLDGDKQLSRAAELLQSDAAGRPVLFLPGAGSPEQWVWTELTARSGELAQSFGQDPDSLARQLARLNALYDAASGGPSEIAKSKLRALAQHLDRTSANVSQAVAGVAADDPSSEVQPLIEALKDALSSWRQA